MENSLRGFIENLIFLNAYLALVRVSKKFFKNYTKKFYLLTFSHHNELTFFSFP